MIVKKDNSAFNLNPCFLSLCHYTENCTDHPVAKDGWRTIIAASRSGDEHPAGRCNLDPGLMKALRFQRFNLMKTDVLST